MSDKYIFNFDYEKTKISEIESFVKYCIEDLYGVQDKNTYNVTTLHIASIIDKVNLDGRIRTLFSFLDFEDEMKVAFVVSKKKNIEVKFDVNFNTTNKIDNAISELKGQRDDKMEVKEEFEYCASLMVDWRMNSMYKTAYTDLYMEYEATLGSLIYALKKTFEEFR